MNESTSRDEIEDRTTSTSTNQSVRRGHTMRYLKATSALVALLVVVAAPPLLLVRFIGNPWPAGGIDLGAPLSDDAINGLLAVVAWVLWVQVLVCVVVETVATVRASSVDVRIPGVLGVQQHLARTLITAIAITLVSVPAAMRPPTAAAAPVAAVPTPQTGDVVRTPQPVDEHAPVDNQGSLQNEADSHEVTVVRGDTLWSIAERHLGYGERWPEIAQLNEGRTMAANQTFRSADLIRPGWALLIPGKASAASKAPDADGDYTVQPGDTLSEIALEHVGNADAWHTIFEDSQKLDQPVPLTDPDLIYPGQQIDLPNIDAPKSPTLDNPGPAPAPETIPQSRPPAPRDLAENGLSGHEPKSPRAIEGETTEPPVTVSHAPTGSSSSRAGSRTEGADAESGSQLPGWVMPGLLGAGTMLAGSLLLALKKRRAHQHRNRRPGHTTPTLSKPLSAVEKSVTVAGASTTPTVELLDALLKRLASSLASNGDALPDLAAVEITDTAVAIHLRKTAVRPDLPWVISHDGLCWVIDKNIDLSSVGPDPADMPPPWPLLVTIGQDEQGGMWLLNIEDLNVHVTGDSLAMGDFARFLAAEVACNPWSSHTALDLVGIAAEIAPISPDRIRADHERATTAEAVAEAVKTIDRLAEQDTTTPTARARQDDPDPWPSRLVIVGDRDTTDELTQLMKLVCDHRGRSSTSVLLAGTAAGPAAVDEFEIHIDERRQLVIPSVNLRVNGVGLTSDEAHGCAALLAQADQTEDAPAPELPGDHAWQAMATATGSLRDQYRIGRDIATLEPSSSLLEEDDEVYVGVAATTREDLDAVAPKVTSSVSREVADADPGLDSDLEQWSSADCARPRLTLLGPVGARTSGTAIDRRKPFYTELFAYIATRPHGATTDEVAAAFDLTPARVRTDINTLRRWLGTDAATGEGFLPDARNAPSAQRRGIGVYEVPDALVDADLFRRLRVRGESRGPDGIDDLIQALQLVTGRPLEKLRLGGWAWLLEGDRLDEHLVCAIADVAHVVVTHSLHAGTIDQARSAVEIAVLAAPDEEISRLDLAAVLDAQGHHTAAERLVLDEVCNRTDDGDAPTELPARTERIVRARGWLNRAAI